MRLDIEISSEDMETLASSARPEHVDWRPGIKNPSDTYVLLFFIVFFFVLWFGGKRHE